MKRSEVNRIIRRGKEFFGEMHFCLPPWAFWTPEEWNKRGEECREIVENMLGWDITDFGSGDFGKRGLFLFTLRNGKPGRGVKPYAEKIMIVEVSAVNDDTTDNRFFEELGRFPALIEDGEPLHLLVSDYRRYVSI